MELSKALETIKAVCDDAVGNGRFKSIDDVATVTDAFNTLVGVANFAANVTKQSQPASDAPTQDAAPASDASDTTDAPASDASDTTDAPAQDAAPQESAS
jgi:hypothetical protein